jgi:hypothetical protein
MRLLWQTAAADLTPAEAPVFAQPAPAVYLAVAVPELPLTQHDRRRHQLASAEAEPTATAARSGHLQRPSIDPRTQKIILDSPPLLPPFPTEHNIRAGMPRARLVRAFGKPDLSLRTMQQQKLIETCVYEQPDRTTLVVIQDGRVVSAYSAQPQQARVLSSEPDPDF